MNTVKTSETRTVMRSQIGMNPVNPKRHADSQVETQRRNIAKVGFLGGVVWNETTGRLVDGHRRLMALDRMNRYDGTPATDYEVKVERVEMDEKTEKEQMTFMSVANTRPDLELISRYAADIDLSEVGLSDAEIRQMQAYMAEDIAEVEELFDTGWNPIEDERMKKKPEATDGLYPAPPAQPEAGRKESEDYARRKEEMLDGKRRNRENAERRAAQLDAYITLSFSSYECYAEFCRLMDVEEGSKFAKGEVALTMIEKSNQQ